MKEPNAGPFKITAAQAANRYTENDRKFKKNRLRELPNAFSR